MDYTNAKSFKSQKDAESALTEELESAGVWWALDEDDDSASAAWNAAKQVEANSSSRQQADIKHARLYENVEVNSLTGSDYADSLVRQQLLGTGLVSLNVVAACTDAVMAKISKNKPRPNFLTSGGSWPQQQKARRLDKFVRGLFYEVDLYNHAQQCFLDACVFGTGLLHWFPNDDGRLQCERVIPSEIYVDEAESVYGQPRSLYRKKFVSQDVLFSAFPDKQDAIFGAQEETDITRSARAGARQIEVWECWHLPSKKGAKDGKHVIVTSKGELFCEPWKLQSFPFVRLVFKRRLVGFWGKGVAETLVGIQIELNRLIRSISEQLRRKGKGTIFAQVGTKLNVNHMTNDIGNIVFYSGGVPPTRDNSNAVSPEEFAQVDRLYQRAFQEVGVSELSAQSRKPSGLDAAVALREFSDIESERFAIQHQMYENFIMDCAKLALTLIREQFGHKGYLIRLPSKRFVIEMDWKDINLDADSYVMQCFPTSSLPQNPGARYQKVKEMMQDGFIDKPVAQRLLEFPDIDAESNLANAAIDDVDATISKVLDDETPTLLPIEPYQNLALMVERCTAALLYARQHGCDAQRLEMLETLLNQATAKVVSVQSAMPGAPPPGDGMPMPAAAGGGPQMGDLNVNVGAPQASPMAPPVVQQ